MVLYRERERREAFKNAKSLEEEREEMLAAWEKGGPSLGQGLKTAGGMVVGALDPVGEYIGRGFGLGSELDPFSDKIKNNELIGAFEAHVENELLNSFDPTGKPYNKHWVRGQRNQIKRELVDWLGSMNPDQTQVYKDLGAPARHFGTKETKLPDGSIKYGNSSFEDSPLYKRSPGFWDSYERWSTMPFSQVREELQAQLGPGFQINEENFRRQMNNYHLLKNNIKEVESLHQQYQYPEDSAYIRDFKGYVDQWEALDKSGGVAGGLANWWDDVKAMGEGTYQFLTSLAGMAELEPKTSKLAGYEMGPAVTAGREFGSSFTGGLEGSLAAAFGVDKKTGERRIHRKPMILLGVVGPTIFNLARAVKHGYASPTTIAKVDAQIKADSRFGKAFNKAMDLVDVPISYVKRKAEPVVGPIRRGFEKLDAIDPETGKPVYPTGSFIRKDEAVGRPGAQGVDMPTGNKFKLDPDDTFNVDPVSFHRRQGAYKVRTVGDLARGALKDMGFWTITGLPITNPLGALAAVGAQGLARWGYGAALKNSSTAMRVHRLLTKNFTLRGKLGQLDNVDERIAAMFGRDFSASLEKAFRVHLTSELRRYMAEKAAGKKARRAAPDEISQEEHQPLTREVEGAAAAKSEKPDVTLGPVKDLVDSRLVAERYENTVKASKPRPVPKGTGARVVRDPIPEEVKANYLRAKNKLGTINDTLRAQGGDALSYARNWVFNNRGERIPNLESFINDAIEIQAAEKLSDRKLTDPETGSSLNAIELMSLMDREGTLNDPGEFSRRRGYNPGQIDQFEKHTAEIRRLIQDGFDVDDLVWISHLAGEGKSPERTPPRTIGPFAPKAEADKFNIMATARPDTEYTQLTREGVENFKRDRVEAMEEFLKAEQAYKAAEAKSLVDRREQLDDVEVDIDPYAVAEPERRQRTIRVGDSNIVAQTAARAEQVANQNQVRIIREEARRLREGTTTDSVAAFMRESGEIVTAEKVQRGLDLALESIDIAERALIEKYEHGGISRGKTEAEFVDLVEKMDLDDAPDPAFLDDEAPEYRPISRRAQEVTSAVSQFYTLLDEMRRERYNPIGDPEAPSIAKSEIENTIRTYKAFADRYTPKAVDAAIRAGGDVSNTFTSTGDIVIGSPLYQLAQGKRSPVETMGPQATRRKTESEIGKIEEQFDAPKDESVAVNLFNEETGLWEREYLSIEKLGAWDKKETRGERNTRLEKEKSYRVALGEAMKDLSGLSNRDLYFKARKRGLLPDSEAKVLKGKQLVLGDVRGGLQEGAASRLGPTDIDVSPYTEGRIKGLNPKFGRDVRNLIIRRLAQDVARDKKPKLAGTWLQRKLKGLAYKDIPEFAKKNNVDLKGVGRSAEAKKKHIFETLRDRATGAPGLLKARAELEALKTRANSLQANLAADRRRIPEAEATELGLDQAELQSLRDDIREKTLEVRRLESQDRTTRLRDLDTRVKGKPQFVPRQSKERRQQEARLEKAQKEVDALSDKEVIEELSRFDPDAKKKYRLKRVREEGGTVPAPAVEAEMFGRTLPPDAKSVGKKPTKPKQKKKFKFTKKKSWSRKGARFKKGPRKWTKGSRKEWAATSRVDAKYKADLAAWKKRKEAFEKAKKAHEALPVEGARRERFVDVRDLGEPRIVSPDRHLYITQPVRIKTRRPGVTAKGTKQVYKWSPKRVGDAWQTTKKQLADLLDDPKYNRVVMMVGLPGSGKSTWISKNKSSGAVYFDATFTTARGRADIIKRVKESGKNVEAVVMGTPNEVSIQRNLARTADRTVNPDAVKRMAEQLADNPVKKAEGFDVIWKDNDPDAAKPLLEYDVRKFDVATGPMPEGAVEGTTRIPPAREALARFKASGAKPANPTYKFKGSTQEITAVKLRKKYANRVKKKMKKAEPDEAAGLPVDPDLDLEIGKQNLLLSKDPDAKILRVLDKYIEVKGGESKPFTVRDLNALLKEAGEDVRLPTFTTEEAFKAAAKKKAPKPKAKAEAKAKTVRQEAAREKTGAKPKADKALTDLTKEVDALYNKVLKITSAPKKDMRALNTALVGLSSLVGRVGRLAVPHEVKKPLLSKLRDISNDASARVQAQRFSVKYDTLGDEIQALYDGEIIPEMMARSRGSFARLTQALKKRDTGIFDKLQKKVNELAKTNKALQTRAQKNPDNKAYQTAADEASKAYLNAINDQTSVLARMMEELSEGQMQALTDAFYNYGPKVYKRDPQASYMFTKKKAGKEVSLKHASDAYAKSMGMTKLDGRYYLDSNWYVQRQAVDRKLAGLPELKDSPSIQAAIEAEVMFRDMQQAEGLINTELVDKQNRNAKVPGTRENLAVLAADIITDSTARMPEGMDAPFKAEVYRLRKKLSELKYINVLEEGNRIASSGLSPAEKYALYRQLKILDQTQASRVPGVNHTIGRLTKEERNFIHSPVVTQDAVVMDGSTGKARRSEKYIVRLTRPWSLEFEAKMRDITDNMVNRWGRSKQERDAFVSTVMEIFNQGNSLLLSPALRGIVSQMAVMSIDSQIMEARRADARGKRKGMSTEERKNLEKNIGVFLGEFALPFKALPKAAPWSKASVDTARFLAGIPTRFDYFEWFKDADGKRKKRVVGSADIIGLVQDAFDAIKTKKEKQLVVYDAVRNLTGALQSQAKAHSMINMNQVENDRFGISYSDTPLSALAKYTYQTVFKGDARPMSLTYIAADPNAATRAKFVSKNDLLNSQAGRFKEFVDHLQDAYSVDLKQNIASRHSPSKDGMPIPAELTVEYIDAINKKYKTNYAYVLTEDKIRQAFGSMTDVAEGSPVGTFLDQLRDETSTLGDMAKSKSRDLEGIEKGVSFLEGQGKFVDLFDEINEQQNTTARFYSELSKDGTREWHQVGDPDILYAPQGLVTDKVFDITMNKGFLDSVAWDAQLAREMQSAWGTTNSLLKAGLTVKSAITQVGNIVGNKLAIMATTGEDMVSLGVRIANTERLFYAYKKDLKRFKDIADSSKLSPESRDLILAVETISRHTGIDSMDSLNVEIGKKAERGVLKFKPSTTKAAMVGRHIYDAATFLPKGAVSLQEFFYKHGDAAPRRAEVLREFIEGKQLLDDLGVGEAISFKVSRRGYTTFFRDKDGVYQLNKYGKRIRASKDLNKLSPDDFVSKVLASYAVRKVGGRVFNYRNVPRIVERIRSGAAGSLSSLFFSPFISFPYLAADFFGKKGILASTFFEPFFDDSFVTNSKSVMLTKSYKDGMRAARRGLLMTAAQAIRYPDSVAYSEDAKFRREANTFGAVLPARSSKPGFYKYFTWSNANGFETSISLMNYMLGMQAWAASKINKAFGKDEEDLNDFGKMMLAQVAAKESFTTPQLLSLFTFGGNLVASLVADYRAPGQKMGPVTQRLLAAVLGKDQSRFLNALLSRARAISPTGDYSVYRSDILADFITNEEGQIEQFFSLPIEEQDQYLRDNFWPIIFNMRFREKAILDKHRASQAPKNNAIKAFQEGLRSGIIGDIDEKIGLPMTPGSYETQRDKKLSDVVDEAEKKKLRGIQTRLGDAIGPGKKGSIVEAMREYYQALDSYDRRKKSYERALLSKNQERIYTSRRMVEESQRKVKKKREAWYSARQSAASLQRKRRKLEEQEK